MLVKITFYYEKAYSWTEPYFTFNMFGETFSITRVYVYVKDKLTCTHKFTVTEHKTGYRVFGEYCRSIVHAYMYALMVLVSNGKSKIKKAIQRGVEKNKTVDWNYIV